MDQKRFCDLIDVRIVELDLLLTEGKELKVGYPYPNKRYTVVCSKKNRKAMCGILVNTEKELEKCTVITRWRIMDENTCEFYIAEHHVIHHILDHDFEAITDDMIQWGAMSEGLGGWKERWPEQMKGMTPALAQPRFDINDIVRQGDIRDTVDEEGRVVKRIEHFYVHTVETERLMTSKLGTSIPGEDSIMFV
jgi:hypothetical protein